MLDQRRIRWADVVQILCGYFVFAGLRKALTQRPPFFNGIVLTMSLDFAR